MKDAARSIILIAMLSALLGSAAYAQPIVVNNLYDCVRATNGLPYCKQVGASADNLYKRVSEEFFNQYEVLSGRRIAAPTPAPVTVQSVTTAQDKTVVQLKTELTEIKSQIDLLDLVLVQQRGLLTTDTTGIIQETVVVIEERITELKTVLRDKSRKMPSYVTPIKPDDAELHITARKASETYTKIPYFIPGTKETGEFWVEPTVTDNGKLLFKFKFVDVSSSAAEKVRSSINMSYEDLERTQKALLKIAANSKLAHQKKIRRKLDVRVDCFPSSECPIEGQKIEGASSTEMIFSINEDGSTSGRVQRNKGRFEEGYNFSIKSGLLLQAYLNYVLEEGKTEFEAGAASNDELKKMFRQ